jgi:hypothetical protein
VTWSRNYYLHFAGNRTKVLFIQISHKDSGVLLCALQLCKADSLSHLTWRLRLTGIMEPVQGHKAAMEQRVEDLARGGKNRASSLSVLPDINPRIFQMGLLLLRQSWAPLSINSQRKARVVWCSNKCKSMALMAGVSVTLAHIIAYQLATVSWREAAWTQPGSRSPSAGLPGLVWHVAATDFLCDLGHMPPVLCFCLYSATVRLHHGDQVFKRDTLPNGCSFQLTGMSHLFFLDGSME